MKMRSMLGERPLSRTMWLAPLAVAAMGAAPMASAATITIPPVSVGAGMQTKFVNIDDESAAKDVNDFKLDSARIYINGGVTENIKFMFNTEYTGDPDNEVIIVDAVARFEFSPQFNIWAGRFLPPSDRANLYGPYYANHWGVYQDGIQDGYPFIAVGRDNGVVYWGDFDKIKFSIGVFDVPSTMASYGGKAEDVLLASRLQINFWDAESGYYLNGTYYGDKDLFSLGFAGQTVDGDSAYNADLLIEKKLPGGAVFGIESEYAVYDELGGYGVGGSTKSDGGYVLSHFIFPQPVGVGKIQLLGKYAMTTYETLGGDTDQDTLEFNVNYLIKSFNARVGLFYIDTTYDGPVGSDRTQIGVAVQLQM